jgi:hypothetical protein
MGTVMANISDLDAWIDEAIRISSQHKYYPTTFMNMRRTHGTVGAIERLVISGDIQSGFRRLKELGLLQWTIEQAVLTFSNDFPNPEVRKAAQWRLDQARRER